MAMVLDDQLLLLKPQLSVHPECLYESQPKESPLKFESAAIYIAGCLRGAAPARAPPLPLASDLYRGLAGDDPAPRTAALDVFCVASSFA